MAKFRKKPVVIEAVPWTGSNWDRIEAFCAAPDPVGGVSAQYASRDAVTGSLFITTLEGEMRANAGDWIIRGVNGEFYPCKPDIFDKTYEAVED